MEWYQYFLSMLTLVFAVASIVAGIFTAYFGSGKSRAVGGILIVIGLIVGIIFLWFAGLLGFMGTPMMSFKGAVVDSVLAVIGAVVGALIALGIFLLAIMKA
ncbi:MAG: hypothetical protein KKC68_07500 [Candidatus Thermoplasmatota archaeon]|nr:hypothetical protein [Candidatus Thermoplasmatota archaeon]MBU1941603.1 hypothetical protein [Candidatus Thermoplasmatota archaeon]